MTEQSYPIHDTIHYLRPIQPLEWNPGGWTGNPPPEHIDYWDTNMQPLPQPKINLPGSLSNNLATSYYKPVTKILKLLKSNNGRTIVTIILDESSSMSPYRDTVIEGCNKFIQDLKDIENLELRTITFSDTINRHSGSRITKNTRLTREDYNPNGMTALYDAIGEAIESMGRADAERKSLVIFTDGQENASKSYNYDTIEQYLTAFRECGWDINFASCDEEAIRQAATLNIPTDKIYRFAASNKGVSRGLEDIAYTTSHYCSTGDNTQSIESLLNKKGENNGKS